MEMEMEISAATQADLGLALERLNAAAVLFEEFTERFAGVDLSGSSAGAREQELVERLAAAEATIVSLRAEAAQVETVRASGRKTSPVGVAALASRDGIAVDASALDTSLRSLSVEQRIAVKLELLRNGLLA